MRSRVVGSPKNSAAASLQNEAEQFRRLAERRGKSAISIAGAQPQTPARTASGRETARIAGEEV